MFSRFSAWFCGVLCVLLIAGCGGSGDEEANVVQTEFATVSVYNLLNANGGMAPMVDLSIGGERRASGIVFQGSSGDLRITWPTEVPQVSIEAAATSSPGTVLFDGIRTFMPTVRYFGFLVGQTNPTVGPITSDIVFLPRNTGDAPSGKVQVRFFNSLADKGPYDIWAGPAGALTRVAADVAFKGVSPFVEFPAPSDGGNIEVRLAAPGQPPFENENDAAITTFTDSNWEAGQIYTVVISRLSSNTASRVRCLNLAD